MNTDTSSSSAALEPAAASAPSFPSAVHAAVAHLRFLPLPSSLLAFGPLFHSSALRIVKRLLTSPCLPTEDGGWAAPHRTVRWPHGHSVAGSSNVGSSINGSASDSFASKIAACGLTPQDVNSATGCSLLAEPALTRLPQEVLSALEVPTWSVLHAAQLLTVMPLSGGSTTAGTSGVSPATPAAVLLQDESAAVSCFVAWCSVLASSRQLRSGALTQRELGPLRRLIAATAAGISFIPVQGGRLVPLQQPMAASASAAGAEGDGVSAVYSPTGARAATAEDALTLQLMTGLNRPHSYAAQAEHQWLPRLSDKAVASLSDHPWLQRVFAVLGIKRLTLRLAVEAGALRAFAAAGGYAGGASVSAAGDANAVNAHWQALQCALGLALQWLPHASDSSADDAALVEKLRLLAVYKTADGALVRHGGPAEESAAAALLIAGYVPLPRRYIHLHSTYYHPSDAHVHAMEGLERTTAGLSDASGVPLWSTLVPRRLADGNSSSSVSERERAAFSRLVITTGFFGLSSSTPPSSPVSPKGGAFSEVVHVVSTLVKQHSNAVTRKDGDAVAQAVAALDALASALCHQYYHSGGRIVLPPQLSEVAWLPRLPQDERLDDGVRPGLSKPRQLCAPVHDMTSVYGNRVPYASRAVLPPPSLMAHQRQLSTQQRGHWHQPPSYSAYQQSPPLHASPPPSVSFAEALGLQCRPSLQRTLAVLEVLRTRRAGEGRVHLLSPVPTAPLTIARPTAPHPYAMDPARFASGCPVNPTAATVAVDTKLLVGLYASLDTSPDFEPEGVQALPLFIPCELPSHLVDQSPADGHLNSAAFGSGAQQGRSREYDSDDDEGEGGTGGTAVKPADVPLLGRFVLLSEGHLTHDDGSFGTLCLGDLWSAWSLLDQFRDGRGRERLPTLYSSKGKVAPAIKQWAHSPSSSTDASTSDEEEDGATAPASSVTNERASHSAALARLRQWHANDNTSSSGRISSGANVDGVNITAADAASRILLGAAALCAEDSRKADSCCLKLAANALTLQLLLPVLQPPASFVVPTASAAAACTASTASSLWPPVGCSVGLRLVDPGADSVAAAAGAPTPTFFLDDGSSERNLAVFRHHLLRDAAPAAASAASDGASTNSSSPPPSAVSMLALFPPRLFSVASLRDDLSSWLTGHPSIGAVSLRGSEPLRAAPPPAVLARFDAFTSQHAHAWTHACRILQSSLKEQDSALYKSLQTSPAAQQQLAETLSGVVSLSSAAGLEGQYARVAVFPAGQLEVSYTLPRPRSSIDGSWTVNDEEEPTYVVAYSEKKTAAVLPWSSSTASDGSPPVTVLCIDAGALLNGSPEQWCAPAAAEAVAGACQLPGATRSQYAQQRLIDALAASVVERLPGALASAPSSTSGKQQQQHLPQALLSGLDEPLWFDASLLARPAVLASLPHKAAPDVPSSTTHQALSSAEAAALEASSSFLASLRDSITADRVSLGGGSSDSSSSSDDDEDDNAGSSGDDDDGSSTDSDSSGYSLNGELLEALSEHEAKRILKLKEKLEKEGKLKKVGIDRYPRIFPGYGGSGGGGGRGGSGSEGGLAAAAEAQSRAVAAQRQLQRALSSTGSGGGSGAGTASASAYGTAVIVPAKAAASAAMAPLEATFAQVQSDTLHLAMEPAAVTAASSSATSASVAAPPSASTDVAAVTSSAPPTAITSASTASSAAVIGQLSIALERLVIDDDADATAGLPAQTASDSAAGGVSSAAEQGSRMLLNDYIGRWSELLPSSADPSSAVTTTTLPQPAEMELDAVDGSVAAAAAGAADVSASTGANRELRLGRAGERLVYQLLQSVCQRANAASALNAPLVAVWRNETGEAGWPFDIAICEQRLVVDGNAQPSTRLVPVRFIEVKTTARTMSGQPLQFRFSLAEASFARKFGPMYELALVSGLGRGQQQPVQVMRVSNPAGIINRDGGTAATAADAQGQLRLWLEYAPAPASAAAAAGSERDMTSLSSAAHAQALEPPSAPAPASPPAATSLPPAAASTEHLASAIVASQLLPVPAPLPQPPLPPPPQSRHDGWLQQEHAMPRPPSQATGRATPAVVAAGPAATPATARTGSTVAPVSTTASSSHLAAATDLPASVAAPAPAPSQTQLSAAAINAAAIGVVSKASVVKLPKMVEMLAADGLAVGHQQLVAALACHDDIVLLSDRGGSELEDSAPTHAVLRTRFKCYAATAAAGAAADGGGGDCAPVATQLANLTKSLLGSFGRPLPSTVILKALRSHRPAVALPEEHVEKWLRRVPGVFNISSFFAIAKTLAAANTLVLRLLGPSLGEIGIIFPPPASATATANPPVVNSPAAAPDHGLSATAAAPDHGLSATAAAPAHGLSATAAAPVPPSPPDSSQTGISGKSSAVVEERSTEPRPSLTDAVRAMLGESKTPRPLTTLVKNLSLHGYSVMTSQLAALLAPFDDVVLVPKTIVTSAAMVPTGPAPALSDISHASARSLFKAASSDGATSDAVSETRAVAALSALRSFGCPVNITALMPLLRAEEGHSWDEKKPEAQLRVIDGVLFAASFYATPETLMAGNRAVLALVDAPPVHPVDNSMQALQVAHSTAATAAASSTRSSTSCSTSSSAPAVISSSVSQAPEPLASKAAVNPPLPPVSAVSASAAASDAGSSAATAAVADVSSSSSSHPSPSLLLDAVRLTLVDAPTPMRLSRLVDKLLTQRRGHTVSQSQLVALLAPLDDIVLLPKSSVIPPTADPATLSDIAYACFAYLFKPATSGKNVATNLDAGSRIRAAAALRALRSFRCPVNITALMPLLKAHEGHSWDEKPEAQLRLVPGVLHCGSFFATPATLMAGNRAVLAASSPPAPPLHPLPAVSASAVVSSPPLPPPLPRPVGTAAAAAVSSSSSTMVPVDATSANPSPLVLKPQLPPVPVVAPTGPPVARLPVPAASHSSAAALDGRSSAQSTPSLPPQQPTAPPPSPAAATAPAPATSDTVAVSPASDSDFLALNPAFSSRQVPPRLNSPPPLPSPLPAASLAGDSVATAPAVASLLASLASPLPTVAASASVALLPSALSQAASSTPDVTPQARTASATPVAGIGYSTVDSEAAPAGRASEPSVPSSPLQTSPLRLPLAAWVPQFASQHWLTVRKPLSLSKMARALSEDGYGDVTAEQLSSLLGDGMVLVAKTDALGPVTAAEATHVIKKSLLQPSTKAVYGHGEKPELVAAVLHALRIAGRPITWQHLLRLLTVLDPAPVVDVSRLKHDHVMRVPGVLCGAHFYATAETLMSAEQQQQRQQQRQQLPLVAPPAGIAVALMSGAPSISVKSSDVLPPVPPAHAAATVASSPPGPSQVVHSLQTAQPQAPSAASSRAESAAAMTASPSAAAVTSAPAPVSSAFPRVPQPPTAHPAAADGPLVAAAAGASAAADRFAAYYTSFSSTGTTRLLKPAAFVATTMMPPALGPVPAPPVAAVPAMPPISRSDGSNFVGPSAAAAAAAAAAAVHRNAGLAAHGPAGDTADTGLGQPASSSASVSASATSGSSAVVTRMVAAVTGEDPFSLSLKHSIWMHSKKTLRPLAGVVMSTMPSRPARVLDFAEVARHVPGVSVYMSPTGPPLQPGETIPRADHGNIRLGLDY